MTERGDGVDFATVSSYIIDNGGEDLFGALGELVRASTSVSNIRTHIKRVKGKSIEREALFKLSNAISIINGEGETSEKMESVLAEVSCLEANDTSGKPLFKTMREVYQKLMAELDERQDSSLPNGISTGIETLDMILGARGLRPRDFMIIGARPAGGKSMVSAKMALHVAIEMQKPVLVFSLEMGDTELMQRFISQMGHINSGVFYDGAQLYEKTGLIHNAATPIVNSSLVIDDRPSLTFAQLAKSARQFKKLHPDAAMIVLDYIMLMKVDSQGKRQDQAYGDVSQSLIALGKELNVVMVILSQCNKSCESRNDKRPIASDLKEISQLEADATHVMMLFNESAYNEDTPMGKTVELILRKNRHGGLGTGYQEIKGGWMEDISHGELNSRLKKVEEKNEEKNGYSYGSGGGFNG